MTWRAHTPSADDPPRQGRLLGCRDQAAQVDGLADFPVYTVRRTPTCATWPGAQLLAAPDAVYPQFATHNAHTVAAVYHAAGSEFRAASTSFQCLHGMGEPLYEHVVARRGEGSRVPHLRAGGNARDLARLPGAPPAGECSNSSFVNRIADEDLPIEELVADPVTTIEQQASAGGVLGAPHPAIVRAATLGAARRNSIGLDLANESQLSNDRGAAGKCAAGVARRADDWTPAPRNA